MRFVATLSLTAPLLALTVPVFAHPDAERITQVSSRVAGVTVYPKRAQIRRVAEQQLSAGAHRLIFQRLPKELTADSVRVSAAGVPGVVLHGFDLRSVLLGSPPVKEVEALEKRLQGLTDQQRTLNDQRAVHQRHLDTIVETAKKAPDGFAGQLSQGKAQLKTWRELLVFMEQRQANQVKAIQAIDLKLRDVSQSLKLVRADLKKLRGFRQQAFQQVEVLLETPRAGKVMVEVEYGLADAGWTPAHDARLDVNGKSLEWRSYGVVRQSTGEHWNDVALTFSTAQPAVSSTPPALREWFIHPFTPEVYYPGAPGARAKSALPSRAMRQSREAESALLDEAPAAGAPAQEARVSVSDQGTSVSLNVPRRVSIPSDGEPHQIPIGPVALVPEIDYRVIPRYSSHAYLELNATHPGPWPLLPGPVKSFVGKDFVGTLPLRSEVPVSSRFTFPMGIDRALTVKRLRLAKQTGVTGLIQKKNFAHYRFEVTLTNNKSSAQTVRVLEPLPQSTVSDIQITVEPGAVAPMKDLPPGQLGWRLPLAAGEKKVVVWGYKVEWPQDVRVSGLE
jgi:uncharacterized protein (TIGR02231 family)